MIVPVVDLRYMLEDYFLSAELFNDWGGRGYDDSDPGEVTKTAPSGDRTTGSPTWSANLPRIQLIPPGGWLDLSPVGDVFVPSPPQNGDKFVTFPPPPIVGRVRLSSPTIVSSVSGLTVVTSCCL